MGLLLILYIWWIFGKCIMTCTHQYRIIQNSCTALKIQCSTFSPIPSNPSNQWSFDFFHSFWPNNIFLKDKKLYEYHKTRKIFQSSPGHLCFKSCVSAWYILPRLGALIHVPLRHVSSLEFPSHGTSRPLGCAWSHFYIRTVSHT